MTTATTPTPTTAAPIGDLRLANLWEKLNTGERLTREDGVALFATEDLLGLGWMANRVKQRRWGQHAHFVLNRQINPTNICVLSCKFCDFGTKRNRPHAYAMTIEEVLGKCHEDLREVHVVGGLHPDWKFEDYLHIVQVIKERFPHIQIKAYTAVEIDWFARLTRRPVTDILAALKAAGLSALPGGGAEVFSERVRKALFPFKLGAPRWLEIHRMAHQMGIPSNATLLYGHIETHEERVDHMVKLRALQDDTGGFLSFIPLAFQRGHTNLVARQASAMEDLKTVAVARLLLDNFPHIKAYWVMLGEEIASLALHFGADDMDGTIGEEKIAHAALAASPVGLTRERLLALIRDAGQVPVERDALYRVLHVYDHPR